MRHALGLVPVDEHLLHVFQASQHTVVQRLYANVLHAHFFFGDAVGLAHTHNLVRGQRAAAHAPLVPATVHLRLDTDARLAAHKQRADAFGSVGFVRGQAHQIDGQLAHVDVNPACGLRSIDVEDHAFFAADIA